MAGHTTMRQATAGTSRKVETGSKCLNEDLTCDSLIKIIKGKNKLELSEPNITKHLARMRTPPLIMMMTLSLNCESQRLF